MIKNIPADFVDLPCPRCGAPGSLKVSQGSFKSQLRWSETVACNQCNLKSEADGVGFLPSSLREAFIRIHGEWQVRFNEVKSIPKVVKALQNALSIEMLDANKLVRSDLKVIYKGTKNECLWLGQLMEELGESISIEQET